MEFSAVNRRRPSRGTPLGPGAKKDGGFRRLRLVPSFADGFVNQLFVVNGLDYVLEDSLVKMWFQTRILWLSLAVSPHMHLWFHQHINVDSFSKLHSSHDAYSSSE